MNTDDAAWLTMPACVFHFCHVCLLAGSVVATVRVPTPTTSEEEEQPTTTEEKGPVQSDAIKKAVECEIRPTVHDASVCTSAAAGLVVVGSGFAGKTTTNTSLTGPASWGTGSSCSPQQSTEDQGIGGIEVSS